jgi:hypothetical protein
MHTSAELVADFIATTSSIVRGRSSFGAISLLEMRYGRKQTQHVFLPNAYYGPRPISMSKKPNIGSWHDSDIPWLSLPKTLSGRIILGKQTQRMLVSNDCDPQTADRGTARLF